MEFVDTLLGAALVGAGVALGMWRERDRKPRQVKKIEAVCGCRHHRSFHKNDGVCQNGYGLHRCQCQHYRGPKPFSEVMDEELS